MDWESLIFRFLDPILARCFSQQSAEDPKEYLRDHYDTATGRMDTELVRDTIPATRRAVRKSIASLTPRERKSFPRYTRDELRGLAEKRLIDAMNASESEMRAVFQAAAALHDDED